MRIVHFGNKDITPAQNAIDLPDLVWHSKETLKSPLKQNGEPNEEAIKNVVEATDKQFEGTIDLTLFFVDSDNWTRDGSLGVKLGNRFNNSLIAIVKRRRNYSDTVEHEFLHAANHYIYLHTGIKLKHVFGVDDFADIIHGNIKGVEEYEYDWVYDKILPYFKRAVKNDSKGEIRSLTSKLIRLMRQKVINIRNKFEESRENTELDEQLEYFAKTVWGEASGESRRGQRGVACVIKNRVNMPSFPNTYKKVVLEPLQFSVWNENSKRLKEMKNLKVDKNETYAEIVDICREVMQPNHYDITFGADHYEALPEDQEPSWADDTKRTVRIGNHEFYKLR